MKTCACQCGTWLCRSSSADNSLFVSSSPSLSLSVSSTRSWVCSASCRDSSLHGETQRTRKTRAREKEKERARKNQQASEEGKARLFPRKKGSVGVKGISTATRRHQQNTERHIQSPTFASYTRARQIQTEIVDRQTNR